MLEGKIANINGKYVIINEKKPIINNEIVSTILPDDIVEYTVKDNNIFIHNIKKREKTTQYILGVVKKIENNNAYLYCINYPKTFCPVIKGKYDLLNVLLLRITINSIDVIEKYDSIMNRKNDINMILSLYRLQSQNNIELKYIKNDRNYYTKDNIIDLTHLDTFNVDPTESKDFDDAISIYDNRIYIHIVDGHNMIPMNSDIDINAFSKAFTLYLPEHIENILPKEMAEYDFSLVKGERRNVITVEYTLDGDNIINYEIYRSIIIIKERYDYNKFNKVLDMFPTLVSLYKKNINSIKINIPHVKLNIMNNVISSYNYEYNCDMAHKIIEMLMILTNSTISNHIKETCPQRFHSSIKNSINHTIDNITGNNIVDNILFIKKYRNALYNNTEQGHFGLGLTTYTHFTSPIRRYFDVIIHRILAGYTYDNINNILDHINSMERNIDKMVKLYNMLKILDHLDNKEKIWNGYIISKSNMGITVIIQDILYEVFIFTNKSYNIGDMVSIKIKNILWETLEIKAIMN